MGTLLNDNTRSRWFTPLRKLLVAGALAAMAISVLVPPVANEAAAVSASGFKAGNIISDALFYDGSAMTSSQVGSFLKKRVPQCTIGDSGKPAGGYYTFPNGTRVQLAKKCLRDYTMTTKSKPANAYCKAYSGKSNETAAEIITRVGKACGISQKVLLVLLEKEQSLVSDDFPSRRQVDVAMGYACPDSGPNWSASCDPAYYGFYNQVYHAAWQLKVYKMNPGSFNYRAFQTNTIQWHPNTGCGTSKVYVENYATAALYIYTPYRPNSAALNAGWGTGNDCSTYGNRNFYLFYQTWFGSTQAKSVNGVIKQYVDANGGIATFGEPIANKVVRTQNGGGVSQQFQNGLIAYSKLTKKTVYVPNGRTLSKYLKANGPAGAWGWPKAAQKYVKSAKAYETSFQRGLVVDHQTLGVKLIPNKTLNVWLARGGAGTLGYPVQQGVVVNSSTVYQRFQSGTVMVSPSAKNVVLNPAEASRWRNAGGHSKLGLALANQTTLSGKGNYLRTQKGILYTKSGGTAVFVPRGATLSAYTNAGGPAKQGWPRTALNCTLPSGGCKLTLDTKTLVTSPKSGASFVAQDHYSYWSKLGTKRFTTLGYPLQSTKSTSGGTLQRYQNGMTAIDAKSKKLTRLNAGPILTAYIKSGWYQSSWGLPINVSSTTGAVRFENGVARLKNGTVTFTKNSSMARSQSLDPATDPVTPDPTEADEPTDGTPTETPATEVPDPNAPTGPDDADPEGGVTPEPTAGTNTPDAGGTGTPTPPADVATGGSTEAE